MLNIKKSYYSFGAALTLGTLVSSEAMAAPANNFNSIASNMTTSIASLPSLLSALAYLFGLLLGVLGIMKIKDHVENPTQTPLKDGAIRLAAGGALFALPIVFEAMNETIEGTASSSGSKTASLNRLKFN